MEKVKRKGKWAIIFFALCVTSVTAYYFTNGYLRECKCKSILLFIFTMGVMIFALIFLVLVLAIIIDIAANKRKKLYPYDFDYQTELATYKRVGNKADKKIDKAFNNYSEWAKYIKEKYTVEGDDNCKNFERYLIKSERSNRLILKSMETIVIPIEILFFELWLTIDDSFRELDIMAKFIIVLLCLGIMIVFFTIWLNSAREEIDFVNDVSEILFPDEH